jgi:hypothetical protein
MKESLKGKVKPERAEQLELLERMQRLRDAWLDARMRRIEVIQEQHC